MGRKRIEKEMIIKSALDFYNLNGRSPKYNEIGYSRTACGYYWDTHNDFLRETNLPLNVKDRNTVSTKEDGIKLILEVYASIKRIPSNIDMNRYVNRNVFRKLFGSYENALIESGLQTEPKRILTKEERIDNSLICLRELSESLKRFPTVCEFDNYINTKDRATLISRRNLSANLQMTYLQICDEFLDYKLFVNGYGNVCFDKNNKRCKSVDESKVSNLFINNDLDFEYEPSYKDLIKTEYCRYKFDWVIRGYGDQIYVEYFGMYYPNDKSNLSKEYVNKAHRKIQLCEDNNVTLIAIYPYDLDNDYQGLLDKFNQHGISLVGNNDLTIKS